MKTETAESAFHGSVLVTLNAPDMDDQSRDVDVVIPPVKAHVSQKCKSDHMWPVVGGRIVRASQAMYIMEASAKFK